MAVFGTFVYGSGSYGSSVNLEYMDVLSANTILLRFEDELVVDSSYLDPTNYSISVVSGSGPVTVRRVLPTNLVTSTEIIIVTDNMTYGTEYLVSVSGVSGRAGLPANDSGHVTSRQTKTASILRSIPKHFDKRPESVLASVLTAISISDDQIGGSRNDTFEYGFTGGLGTAPSAPTVSATTPADAEVIPADFVNMVGTYTDADDVLIIVDGLVVDSATLDGLGGWTYTFAPSPAPVVSTDYTLRVVATGEGGIVYVDSTFTLDP